MGGVARVGVGAGEALADVVIGTDDIGQRLASPKANPRYTPHTFGLRPGVVLYAYIKEPHKESGTR